MEVVGAVASIITLVALAKEVSGIAGSLLGKYDNAPSELIHVANQASLMLLELECIVSLQADKDLAYLLSLEESWILKQSLEIAKHNVTAVRNLCTRQKPKGRQNKSRLSWAFFDSKAVKEALGQLHGTEMHLLLVIQLISTKRTIKAHIDNANQSSLILQRLDTYHDEIHSRPQAFLTTSKAGISSNDIDSSIAFRHQCTLTLSKYWEQLLQGGFCITKSKNDFQTAWDIDATLPVPTLTGRMGLIMSLSFRHTWGWIPNISLTGGGLIFASVVPVDSEIVLACQKGDLLSVRDLFLQRKAAPSDSTIGDRTLLYYAVQSGSTELVRFLVNAGAPVRSKQILAASWWRQPETARILLHSGASVEVMGADGFNAASYLFGPSRPRLAQTEFIDILACNSFSQFNAQDVSGWTVLHRAAAWGTSTDVKALLQLHASTSKRTQKLGWTPLACAVCYKNLATLQVLWSEMGDDDAKETRDLRGWNLLHIAAGYGSLEAVPFLLECGVDIEALSQPNNRFVPPGVRGKCVTPAEVARSCGEDAYTRWTEVLRGSSRNIDIEPEEIDWTENYVGGGLGECECCDNWNELPSTT